MGNSELSTASSLAIEGVSKRYPNGKVALDSVSLSIEAGQFVVLLGPSGSGKTSLLRCIAGIEGISAGRIAIDGRTVSTARETLSPDKRSLSMVFQDYALWPHMKVWENVAFSLNRYGLAKAERKRRALEILERTSMARLAERYPGELSGGEQQRVALSRALLGSRTLVLFDEPLSNLDADLKERLRLEISTLTRETGATCIYITHDQSEAFAIADKIGVMRSGRLEQVGDPEEIYRSPASPFVARFTKVATEMRAIVTSHGGGADVQVQLVGPAPSTILGRAITGVPEVGRSVTVLVRPHTIELVDATDPTAAFVARVTDVAYRGKGYDVAVVTPNGELISGIHSHLRPTRGSDVGILLDREGVMVFPDLAQEHPDDVLLDLTQQRDRSSTEL